MSCFSAVPARTDSPVIAVVCGLVARGSGARVRGALVAKMHRTIFAKECVLAVAAYAAPHALRTVKWGAGPRHVLPTAWAAVVGPPEWRSDRSLAPSALFGQGFRRLFLWKCQFTEASRRRHSRSGTFDDVDLGRVRVHGCHATVTAARRVLFCDRHASIDGVHDVVVCLGPLLMSGFPLTVFGLFP